MFIVSIKYTKMLRIFVSFFKINLDNKVTELTYKKSKSQFTVMLIVLTGSG